MRSSFVVHLRSTACVLAVGLSMLLPGLAQTKVKVSVDTGKVVNILTSRSLGVGLDGYDGNAADPQTLQFLHSAGVYTLRYPGNIGMSGIYHWSKSSILNPYKEGSSPYLAPANNFASMAAVFDKFGSPIVSVNYGSNLDGSGGGEPAEAAAWVAYANGDPANPLALGKDSKGNDWKTVGFWAGLRAATPIAPDDGYNALRIGHPNSMGIQMWQIGDEAWDNGFYGPDHANQFDLHAGLIPSAKDGGHHAGNKLVGPAVYGAAVSAFAKAMKAVDPKILIGASLTTPTKNIIWNSPVQPQPHWGADWDDSVLKASCADTDFVALSLAEGPSLPPDYKILDEDQLLTTLNTDYHDIAVDLLDRFQKNCPKGHTPRLAFTDFGLASWLTIPHPGVLTLYTADALATLIESGVSSIDWPNYHTPLFLGPGNKPGPAYYGYQMVHIAAYQPGDAFVNAQSNSPQLVVHATKRRDGGYGLLLINKDTKQAAQVTVRYTGDTPPAKGIRFDYGQDAYLADKGLVRTPLENLGGSFTVEVPAATATAILMPKAQ